MSKEILSTIYMIVAVIVFVLIEINFIYRVKKFGFLTTLAQVMELSEVPSSPTNFLSLFFLYPLLFAAVWPGLMFLMLSHLVGKKLEG
jgi:hypothetical protein